MVNRAVLPNDRLYQHRSSEQLALRGLPLQRLPIPFRQIRSRLVRALTEIHQRIFWRRRLTDGVVRQEEFFHVLAVESRRGFDLCLSKTCGLRRSVGIERGLRAVAAGPEAVADYFVGVGFHGDRVRAFTGWRGAAGEAC